MATGRAVTADAAAAASGLSDRTFCVIGITVATSSNRRSRAYSAISSCALAASWASRARMAEAVARSTTAATQSQCALDDKAPAGVLTIGCGEVVGVGDAGSRLPEMRAHRRDSRSTHGRTG